MGVSVIGAVLGILRGILFFRADGCDVFFRDEFDIVKMVEPFCDGDLKGTAVFGRYVSKEMGLVRRNHDAHHPPHCKTEEVLPMWYRKCR